MFQKTQQSVNLDRKSFQMFLFIPSYGSQFRKERSSMAMSPVKSSPTVPSIRIYQRGTTLKLQVEGFSSPLKWGGGVTWKGLELVR